MYKGTKPKYCPLCGSKEVACEFYKEIYGHEETWYSWSIKCYGCPNASKYQLGYIEITVITG